MYDALSYADEAQRGDAVLELLRHLQHCTSTLQEGKQQDPHEGWTFMTSHLPGGMQQALMCNVTVQTTCTGCHVRTPQTTSTCCLTVPIVAGTLEAYLTHYVQPQRLGTPCETCGGPMTETPSLHGSPAVLVMALMRFTNEGRKLMTPVTIPLHLTFAGTDYMLS